MEVPFWCLSLEFATVLPPAMRPNTVARPALLLLLTTVAGLGCSGPDATSSGEALRGAPRNPSSSPASSPRSIVRDKGLLMGSTRGAAPLRNRLRAGMVASHAPDGTALAALGPGKGQGNVEAGWCKHVVGGPASGMSPLLTLSAAHAAIRQFGAPGTWQGIDLALAHALAGSYPGYQLSRANLSAYVAEFSAGQTCLESVSNAALPGTRVGLAGHVAVVRPGIGELTLPSGAQAVVIDLRGLPNAPGLREALDRAAAMALATPVSRPTRQVLSNFGYMDQWFADPEYLQYLDTWPDDPIPAGAPRDLPLALIVEPAMAADSAYFAATLRMAARAWLIGADLDMSVAESTWAPVSDTQGLQYHVMDLLDPLNSAQWPDSLPEDVSFDDLARFLARLPVAGSPRPVSQQPATRPQLSPQLNPGALQPATLGPGEARAGLIIAHGVWRRFFTYFDVVGDTIDRQLVAALARVDAAASESNGGAIDRTFYHHTLGFLGHALHDAHVFSGDAYSTFYGYLDLVCEEIDGNMVVRRSGIFGIRPGDTITAVDGMPAEAWLAYYSSIESAPTAGGLFQKVMSQWLTYNLTNPTRSFGVHSVDGSRSTVVADVLPFSAASTDGFGSAPSIRSSGPLADFGAPDLYYFNMGYEATPDDATALSAVAQAQAMNATGMIVDMRGYPDTDHYLVASTLIPDTFLSPQFGIPYLVSPDPAGYSIYLAQFPISPTPSPSFSGPLVLLVGNATLSAAENFSMLLVDAKRPVHVVGRQTSGSDGNITGMMLPGGYALSFTGMRITHADGTRFDGIGIVPDVVVPLRAADFAAGRDPELETAVRLLRSTN